MTACVHIFAAVCYMEQKTPQLLAWFWIVLSLTYMT